MIDRERIERCGAQLSTKKDRNGDEYDYVQTDGTKKKWEVLVEVVRTHRIGVFADDARKARHLAASMEPPQVEDEGDLESVATTAWPEGVFKEDDDEVDRKHQEAAARVPGIMGSTVSPIPAIPFTLRIQKDHETITINN
jgi:hypothetical protein